MRRSSIVALAVAGAVLAAGAWFVIDRHASNATASGPVAVDEPLPALTGRSLTGARLSSSSFRGHVTVINVWATWCGPCRREQPALVSLATRYRHRVRFLGIDYRDDRAAAVRWVKDEYDVPYPSFFDPTGRFASTLSFPYLPDTYVVDRSGTIRWVVYGETNVRELSGLVDPMLSRVTARVGGSSGGSSSGA